MKRKFILAVAVLAAISIPASFCEAQPVTSEAAEAKMGNSTNPEIAPDQANAEVAETPAEAEIDPPNPESDFEIDFNEDVTEVYITRYKGESDKIIIPETIQGLPVTKVLQLCYDKTYHFGYQSKITKLFVPPTVKEIYEASGYYYVLGADTENGCEVVLSEGLVSIGDRTFRYAKLASINFPSTLRYIGHAAFFAAKITNKDGIVLNEGLEGIEYSTFEHATFASIKFPSTLRYIERNAFLDADIENKEIVLNEGLQYIGTGAFGWLNYSNKLLNSLTLPASLEYIGRRLSDKVFFMSGGDCVINLPDDTSGWHYFTESNPTYGANGIYIEKELSVKIISLAELIYFKKGSQIAEIRKKENALSKRLESITVLPANEDKVKQYENDNNIESNNMEENPIY